MSPLDLVMDFLAEETPKAWVQSAVDDQATLLLDHANCEMKAASTALALIYRYPEEGDLCARMSRLAREELRHYEQVQALIDRYGFERKKLGPANYAGQLNSLVSPDEPNRLRQRLIVGALIEARSCERFARVYPLLDEPLSGFYKRLLDSEARHFRQYLELANACPEPQGESRAAELRRFVAMESEFNATPGEALRFHGGPPRLERQRVERCHAG